MLSVGGLVSIFQGGGGCGCVRRAGAPDPCKIFATAMKHTCEHQDGDHCRVDPVSS